MGLLISSRCPCLRLDMASFMSFGVQYLFWYFPDCFLVVDQQLVVILLFLEEKVSSSHSTLPS